WRVVRRVHPRTCRRPTRPRAGAAAPAQKCGRATRPRRRNPEREAITGRCESAPARFSMVPRAARFFASSFLHSRRFVSTTAYSRFAIPEPLVCGRFTLTFERPRVMGILNVTPDSFSDGGRFVARDDALRQAEAMIGNGVDIIDIGGESTRPGAPAVPLDEELRRVVPVVEALAGAGV